ncbi:MAG: adenylate kinase [Candidatus Diapherotrites archaeon]|nr:adenylate kinase [Candidatus Diapherotrites archaeon]
MNLVFIGKQGVGKGTYAQKLSAEHGLPQISTGELLREEIKTGSDLGKKVEEIINRGELVSDELVAEMLKSRLSLDDAQKGFILDGFPRTVNQAKALDALLEKSGKKIQAVLNFVAPDSVLLERLTGRRTCKKCGTIYHTKNMPPKKEGICDKCGSELYQRDDDKEQAIKKRWQAYEEQTKPVLEYYRKQGKLEEIDASKEVSEIYPKIGEALSKRGLLG